MPTKPSDFTQIKFASFYVVVSQNDGGGVDSGHVRIYRFSNSMWTLVGIAINGQAADDQFGYSVSLNADGTRVAISGNVVSFIALY